MYKQTAGVTVRGAADLASVRFLACVCESVLLEILEPPERLAASLAMVIRLACMRGDVCFESARLGKRCTAVLTDERSIAGVRSLVIDAVRIGCETAAAVLANVWFVTRMRSHVEHKASVLSKCFAAYMAEETLEIRILLFLGTLVNANVSLQFDFLLKGLVTFLTCVRF